ncbi:MAG: DUF3467 domain-containing protein [Bacteroidales bacterium]|nr:DUF3467 domain-containing protein [Bacteroidales bacterium]MDE6515495.1 DUF3467 domain-containing protein [Bacteroidales bacterium]MDE7103219.1 DUF3467 domain-containing protein [Bacteroidales bacterium]
MAEQKNRKEGQQLDVELSVETAKGVYSNLAMITHSQAEFIVDFLQMLPGIPKAIVRSRIIMTPLHAKRLLAALSDNVSKFEARFGTIKEPERGNDNTIGFLGNNIPSTEA